MPENYIRISTPSLSQKRVARIGDKAKKGTYRRLFRRLSRRSQRRLVRYSLLAANVAVLAIVGSFVIQTKYSSERPNQTAQSVLGNDTATLNPLDQLSSADIAVHIARTAGLPEISGVTQKADTVNAQLTISSADEKVVAKPQVITAGLKSRKDIQKYIAKAGDTVPAVATQFAVTSDTVRWSNNITGDALTPGKELLISPVNGIVYQVKAGDTVDALTSKYQANRDLLIAINDAEISGLPVGQYIVIPDGRPPAAPGRASAGGFAAGGNFAWGGFSPVYGYNGYDYGYCTWYAAKRRADIGRPIPSNLGNASTWKVLAQRAGLGVGGTPAAGAVIWTPPRDYYGHVGFVESVNADGSVNVSEMNTAGWGRVSRKTITAADAARYSYIY